MSISTFAELKTALANFSDRTDLTARLGEFVTLAETRIFYGSMEAPFASDPLRVRAMETSADLTINAQSVALPTRYLGIRRQYISGDTGGKINMVSPDRFWGKYSGPAWTGIPLEFTIEGDNVLFGPAPSGTFTGKMLYWQKFAALSADADTNWLLTNAPGAYLQGALIELYDYLKDFEAKAQAHKAFAGIVNGLMLADKSDRFAGSWVGHTDQYNP
jgi:hypothetical protein